MAEIETEIVETENAEQTAVVSTNETKYELTMWNDPKKLSTAYKAAKFLSESAIVPEQTYKGQPANCLIALDIANRMNTAPLFIMQNLYIVKGKPAWSGSFCAAAIMGCGKFKDFDYVMSEDKTSCYATAVRTSDGKRVDGATISIQMAKDEGWFGKFGSKWATMPEQMLRYRAAAFFARAYCPDVLLGIQTVEEVKDVSGYDEQTEKETVKFSVK